MTGFRLTRLQRVAACAGGLAVALGGCALVSTHAPPQATPPTDPARLAGGRIFDTWCSDCHRAATGPGSLALQRKYRGALPAVLEQRSDLDPAYVKRVVRQGVSFMPSFRKTEIGDADLVLLADFLRPAR